MITTWALALAGLSIGFSGTNISGSINSDQTWNIAGSPYCVTGDTFINNGVTVTVDPGVEVRIESRFSELYVDGRLDCNGSPGNPVLFRGLSLQSIGGSLVYRTGSAGTLAHTDFQYLGNTGFLGALSVLTDASPTVADCTFQDNVNDVVGHEGAFTHFARNQAVYCVLDAVSLGQFAWPEGVYHLLGDVTINSTATLTVEPGAELRLWNRFNELFVDGTLEMLGTIDTPIRVSGQSSQARGSSIVANSGLEGLTIRYTEFENLGNTGADTDAALAIPNPTPVDPVVEDCRFSSNVKDVRGHEGAYSAFARNQGKYWIHDRNVVQPYSWPKGCYLLAEDVVIDANAVLSIEPGAQILLENRFNELFIEGLVDASGTREQPILFRGASSAAIGASVVVRTGSPSVVLDHVEFRFLGNTGFAAALHDSAGTVVMNDCIFIQNVDGFRVLAGFPRARCTHFIANLGFAINNSGTGTVDAKRCWWGAADGPSPGGSGSSINGSVDTTNFEPLPCLFETRVTPEILFPGVVAGLKVRLCNPGEPVIVFVTAINGTPVSPFPLAGLAPAGNTGERGLTGAIPAGTSGISVTVVAYSLGFGKTLRASDPTTFIIQ